MDEQALKIQIEEGKVAIAAAQKLISDNKSLYEQTGVGDDLFAKVLANDNFTPEFKDIVKDERAKAISKMEDQGKRHGVSKRSKIAGHAGVTKI